MAAEFAMGLLRGADRRAFEARMGRDPVLLGEVQDWLEHLAPMTKDMDTRPPRGAKRRLQGRLFGSGRGALRLWQALAGGGLALAAVLALLMFAEPQRQPELLLASEIVAEDQSLRMLAVFDGAALRITRTEGDAVPGRVFELWLIAGDAPPRSLGVLSALETTAQPVPEALQPLLSGGVLAVSDEPIGGSPTGLPTGDVLAVGTLTTL